MASKQHRKNEMNEHRTNETNYDGKDYESIPIGLHKEGNEHRRIDSDDDNLPGPGDLKDPLDEPPPTDGELTVQELVMSRGKREIAIRKELQEEKQRATTTVNATPSKDFDDLAATMDDCHVNDFDEDEAESYESIHSQNSTCHPPVHVHLRMFIVPINIHSHCHIHI